MRDFLFRWLIGRQQWSEAMSKIDDLNAALARLANSVDAAAAKIGTDGAASDAVLETATTAVNAASDKLDAAVNPPPAPVA